MGWQGRQRARQAWKRRVSYSQNLLFFFFFSLSMTSASDEKRLNRVCTGHSLSHLV